jgi:hypothetical protein
MQEYSAGNFQNGYRLSNRGEKNFDGVEFNRRIGQKLGLPYEILRSRPVQGFLWG